MAGSEEKSLVVVEREDTGGHVVAFLVGALIGAGIALLLAPGSGQETRRRLMDGGARIRDAAGTGMREAQRHIGEKLEMAREGARGGVEAVKGAVEVGKKAAGEARRELAERMAASKEAYRDGVGVARHVLANAEAADLDSALGDEEAPAGLSGATPSTLTQLGTRA